MYNKCSHLNFIVNHILEQSVILDSKFINQIIIQMSLKNKISISSIILLLSLYLPVAAQLKVGDPGVKFDESKFDSNYPQMKIWATAGVEGGIPFIKNLKIKKKLKSGSNSATINKAIQKVAKSGGGAIFLKNGTYNIDVQINMASNVSIIGESQEGVICQLHKDINENNADKNPMCNDPKAWDDGNGGFKFGIVENCGIYRLTIKGGWGTPKQAWNIGSKKLNNELPGNENISVWFLGASNCWIDQLTILNSADFPVRCSGTHITMRNLNVDGVFNKHGGCHGYFFLLNGSKYNLVTGCKITHLRHISLQGAGVEYNVVYDNDLAQEISFHTADDGNNLIENNRITLPKDMPTHPNYFAIMGPWASFHHISTHPNFLYKNKCLEMNHKNARPWSDPSVVYSGPRTVKPKDHWTNFPELAKEMTPKGGTLYPIQLNK